MKSLVKNKNSELTTNTMTKKSKEVVESVDEEHIIQSENSAPRLDTSKY